jgi:putative transposase
VQAAIVESQNQNGRVESFNGRLRDECLNANWFGSIQQAQQQIENGRTAVWDI